jgi:cellulose 1,4-beta-cellobiosidase
VANSDGWTPSENDKNAGSGKLGACCPEMDIWEANSIASAYTPHPCSKNGLYACEGTDCGDGDDRYSSVCDKDGCDLNVSSSKAYMPSSLLIRPSPTAWVTPTSMAPA